MPPLKEFNHDFGNRINFYLNFNRTVLHFEYDDGTNEEDYSKEILNYWGGGLKLLTKDDKQICLEYKHIKYFTIREQQEDDEDFNLEDWNIEEIDSACFSELGIAQSSEDEDIDSAYHSEAGSSDMDSEDILHNKGEDEIKKVCEDRFCSVVNHMNKFKKELIMIYQFTDYV